jgi:hypothetical protein
MDERVTNLPFCLNPAQEGKKIMFSNSWSSVITAGEWIIIPKGNNLGIFFILMIKRREANERRTIQ